MGHSFNISEGCERKLVTTCDSTLDLDIRVDFLKNDFSSTKVSIYYEGLIVIIDENLNLAPAASPNNSIIVYSENMDVVSVQIPNVVRIIRNLALNAN